MKLVDREVTLSGVRQIHVNHDGDVVEEFIQDVSPILDMNARFRNGDKPKNMVESAIAGRHVASIPAVVAELWLNKYGINVFNREHLPKVRELLNSREWQYLKTTDKTI